MEGLTAGRELDAIVAERVMGWIDVKLQPIANALGVKVMDEYCGKPTIAAPLPMLVPRYSTMIQEAWPVVEKLRREHPFVALLSGKGPQGAQPWICKVNKEGSFFEERGETATMAVCLAALKSVGFIA
jgi:hypothetical protein